MVLTADNPELAEQIEIRPQPRQELFLSSATDLTFYGGGAFGGKLLSLDTPIPTPTGWSTMGELQAGDCLFDDRGNICRVIVAHPIELRPESYLVRFDDGECIEAGADHLWLTFTASDRAAMHRRGDAFREARRRSRPSRVSGNKSEAFTASLIARNRKNPPKTLPAPTGGIRTTAEIAATILTSGGLSNHYVPVALPLELPDADLPVEPYLLGIWLGDGTTTAGEITTSDAEIVAAFEIAGFVVRKRTSKYSYGVNGFVPLLRLAGVFCNKHVPDVYLRASRQQRMALLQGLMDTDGYACPDGSVEFSNTRQPLADAVAALAISLGNKVNVMAGRARLNGVDVGPKWTVVFTPRECVFRLPRKAVRFRPELHNKRSRFRVIVGCERIEPKPMRCITVDSPNALYLASRSMIPTHNSYAALLDPMRWLDLPSFRGVIFRRTCPEITQEGGLWDESQKLYRALSGLPFSARLLWRFPSGAVIGFKHCQYDDDVFKYKGMQADVMIFDQVEEFTAKQFWYLLSRNRGSSGIDSYCRATLNPQPGWVADFLQWWWNPRSGYAIEERAGVARWFGRVNDVVHWADTAKELNDRFGNIKEFRARSCTFIPAKADDNPIGLSENPGYKAALAAMRHVDMERLLKGNFLIVDDAGAEWPAEYFDDIWAEPWPQQFELSTTAVDVSEGIRKKAGGKDGDYSAIVFGGLLNGTIYIDSDIKRRPVPDIVADAAGMCIANLSQGLAFEGNGFQKLIAPDYERYIRQQSLAIPSAAIIENYGVNKVVRIKRLGGWLKGRRFRFRRTESNNLLLQQLRTFPLAEHDDGPDAMEMMVRDLNAMAAGAMAGEE